MKKIMSESDTHELTPQRCLCLLDIPRGKGIDNFLMEKSSLPRRNLVIEKKVYKKTMISASKTLKNTR